MAAAAPPAASTAAPAGPRLRFCPESNDLLYPQEDKERKVRETGMVEKAEEGADRRPDSEIGGQTPKTDLPRINPHALSPTSRLPLSSPLGPHLCLPQLRVPGGRPTLRLVRVPQRDHTLRPGAHSLHPGRAGGPYAAVHARRGLPGVRA
jgi:hypothetical protein